MQDVFDMIANARETQNGNRIRDGKYEWLVERCFMQEDRKRIPMYITELRVIASEPTEQGVAPNPVGETVGCVWKLDKDSAGGNIKAFLLALLGLNSATTPPEEFKRYSAASVSGDGTAFRGIRIAGSTVRRVNQGRDNPQNKGMVMVFPNFVHVPGQTEESIAQGRAYLDATSPAKPAPAAQFTPPAAPSPVPVQTAPAMPVSVPPTAAAPSAMPAQPLQWNIPQAAAQTYAPQVAPAMPAGLPQPAVSVPQQIPAAAPAPGQLLAGIFKR